MTEHWLLTLRTSYRASSMTSREQHHAMASPSCSITKTEVMLQPKLGRSPRDPVIKIGNKELKAVQKFCYLGGFLSQNTCIDDEITSRIGKASASFGRLHHRLWSDHGIRLSTKCGVYRTVVLTTLLYGSESWTWYCCHVKKILTSSILDASEKSVASLGRTEYQTLLYLNVAR